MMTATNQKRHENIPKRSGLCTSSNLTSCNLSEKVFEELVGLFYNTRGSHLSTPLTQTTFFERELCYRLFVSFVPIYDPPCLDAVCGHLKKKNTVPCSPNE
mmetsp:Transcript_24244/g.28231  ORF Transcript_24244/g.28231 Transcript_24244/m.28231 type:complete len:101 (-) Transcript_24244:15-317(-)